MRVSSPTQTPFEPAVETKTATQEIGVVTLPSGRKIALEWYMQEFFSQLMQLNEEEMQQLKAEIDREHEWKKALDQKRLETMKLARKEDKTREQTGKVRDYTSIATLAATGAAAIATGGTSLGATALVSAFAQGLNSYFDNAGTEKVASWISQLLGSNPQTTKDGLQLFGALGSIGLSMGLSGGTVIKAAAAASQAALGYVEHGAESRHNEYQAQGKEFTFESEEARDRIEELMHEVTRRADEIETILRNKMHALKSNDQVKRAIWQK